MKLIKGNSLEELRKIDEGFINCCVTSPPYWGLRKYDIPDIIFDGEEGCGHEWGNQIECPTNQGQFCLHCYAWRGQLGLEPTPELYVKHIVEIFGEVKRVLRKDGTCWVNLGDSYVGSGKCSGRTWEDGKIPNMSKKQHTDTDSLAMGRTADPEGMKPKDLVGIPWLVAFALRADGWYLRSEIIWCLSGGNHEMQSIRKTLLSSVAFILRKEVNQERPFNSPSMPMKYQWPKASESSLIGSEVHFILTSMEKRWQFVLKVKSQWR
jgi:DNA modification methylase